MVSGAEDQTSRRRDESIRSDEPIGMNEIIKLTCKAVFNGHIASLPKLIVALLFLLKETDIYMVKFGFSGRNPSNLVMGVSRHTIQLD